MLTTDTLTVATVAANSGGVRVEGDVRREGNRFVIYVGGRARGQAGGLGSAAHQLVAAIRRDLPSGSPHGNWGVAVHCLTNGGVGLLYGNAQTGFGGGGGGAVNPCVAQAQLEYRRGDGNLHRALESAAKLLARCCR
jgi:hypothetical protein